MSLRKLPILISVPHGGILVPDELKEKCNLTEKEILLDGDTWTRELFDFKDLVKEFTDTDIARIVIDLNRSCDDLPPKNPDGVVKTVSVVGKQAWTNSEGLSPTEIQNLLSKYYTTYHNRLAEASQVEGIVLAIDCHTMLNIGPNKSNENWTKRPMFCISNRGDETGNPMGEPVTAPPELMLEFKKSLEEHFANFVEVDDHQYDRQRDHQPLVAINSPFKGGYITKHHGTQNTIPWIQLEINRYLYLPGETLSKQTMDETDCKPDKATQEKMQEIRDRLYKVFEEVCSKL